MYSLPDTTNGRVLPAPAGLIAGALVIAGVLLWMFVNKGLLIVAGLGAFGPGILRELGWLNDQDEFQRQAARRAGYHAWLFSALLTYWGARRTTTVVLLIFGSFWLVFGVATIISEATRAVHRWPRITGSVLVAVASLFTWQFGPWGMDDWSTQLLTLTLLALPLFACGIALLRDDRSEETG